MEIGDLVIHDGRRCYLRGVQPMGVSDRLADVELADTGERLKVPFAELELAEPGNDPPPA